MIASASSLILLSPNIISNYNLSWRLMCLIGSLFGIIIVILRLFLPEVKKKKIN